MKIGQYRRFETASSHEILHFPSNHSRVPKGPVILIPAHLVSPFFSPSSHTQDLFSYSLWYSSISIERRRGREKNRRPLSPSSARIDKLWDRSIKKKEPVKDFHPPPFFIGQRKKQQQQSYFYDRLIK